MTMFLLSGKHTQVQNDSRAAERALILSEVPQEKTLSARYRFDLLDTRFPSVSVSLFISTNVSNGESH